MSIFDEFINTIDNVDHQQRVIDVLMWVKQSYPELQEEVKWNQPMFTHHGTFIISFSTAEQHLSVAPEYKTMEQFEAAISKAGYSRTKGLFRIKFSEDVNYDLLAQIISFNIQDKKDCETFWRK